MSLQTTEKNSPLPTPSIVYLINPNGTSMRNALHDLERKLANGAPANEEVVLRISDNISYPLMKDQIKIKRLSTRRDYDDSKDVEDFPSLQEACAELLRTTSDVDITLATGYIIFEVPIGSTSTSDIEPICFLTIEELHDYIVASNASLVQQHERQDTYWDGFETISSDNYLESTMRFRTKYHFVKAELEETINYLRANISSGNHPLKTLASSDPVEIDIYVMSNIPCVVPIIPEHPLYTAPVSKQRLLYIHDVIRAWIISSQSMWLEIDTVGTKTKTFATFRYKFCQDDKAWEALPSPEVSATKILRGLYLPGTVCWKRFTEIEFTSITEIMNSALSFLQDAGIDMELDNFPGSSDDYLTVRGFEITVPTRTPPPTVIIAKQSKGSAHPRHLNMLLNLQDKPHRSQSSHHTSTRGGHKTQEHIYEGRGRGSQQYEGRGRGFQHHEGRGRGSQHHEGRGRGFQHHEGRGRGSQHHEGR